MLVPRKRAEELIRKTFSESGVQVRVPQSDTLLLSDPVSAGKYSVVYRTRLIGSDNSWMLAMDATYGLPGDSIRYVLAQNSGGSLSQRFRDMVNIALTLYERRSSRK